MRWFEYTRHIVLVAILALLTFLAPCSELYAQKKSRWKTGSRNSALSIKTAMRPKLLALMVGVGNYQDSYWRGLRYPTRDARRMGDILKKQGRFDKVYYLTTQKQTTTNSIKTAMRKLRKQNLSPLDTVVVYISGHGAIARSVDRKSRRYVITSNTQTNIPATALSVGWLRRTLRAFPARSKVLILATCYSGDARSKSRRPKGHKGKLVIPTYLYSRSMLILSASSRGEPAFESNKLRGDIYTHFFMRCMKRQYTRLNRCLRSSQRQCSFASATQLHSCSVKGTFRYVRRQFGQNQLPSLESQIDGLSAIYLLNRHSLKRSQTKKVASAQKGTLQIFPRILKKFRLMISQKGKKGAARALTSVRQEVLFLKPGIYRVQFLSRHGQQTGTLTLRLRSGQRMLLSLPRQLLPRKKPKHDRLPKHIQLTLFVKDSRASGGRRKTEALEQLCHWIESKIRQYRDYEQEGYTLKWRRMFPHRTRRFKVWGIMQQWMDLIYKDSRQKKKFKRWFHPTVLAYFAYLHLKVRSRKDANKLLLCYQKSGQLGADQKRFVYMNSDIFHRHWLRLRAKRLANPR